ncbi:hypothetical protein [Streptomyces sp. NPDC087270]|uniref:hypothetical protein n=1 Tax=Streptomyces sp. NPDC087270 TaxID=3365774 RepID=UPI003815C7FE
MASDRQQDHAGGSESVRPKSPATPTTLAAPGEPALPVPKSRADTRGEELVGEATEGGPIIVVTAIALKPRVRDALAQRLGPGHILLDIRHAGPDADIVLIPPASAQLLGHLRRQFPQARILATEFTDDSYGADFRGPISHILDSDIDGYFMAPTLDDLARVTHSAGRAVAGALAGGTGSGSRRPVDFLAANRRLLLESGHAAEPSAAEPSPTDPSPTEPDQADPDQADPGHADAPAQGGVTIDLDAWARTLEGSAPILAGLAWPLILQFLRQGVPVTVVGGPPGSWTDRARAAGVQVRPSSRRLPG